MRYYEVLVANMAYHGSGALTYEYAGELGAGQLVKIPLRGRTTLGVVQRLVAKPDFDSKPIAEAAPFPPLPPQSLELLKWLYAYYPAPLGAVVRLFVPPTEIFPKGNTDTPNVEVSSARKAAATSDTSTFDIRDPGSDTSIFRDPIASQPPLTTEQQKALDSISGSGTFLLHGITGSGKSRVYVELAARTLKAGRSVLMLTPEIGLTAQLTRTFQNIFGNEKVYVLHSAQTAAERRNVWYRILQQSEPVVVIGPRSALFAPVRSIGLIVLDEAHDNAYKNESAPHYLAARAAARLAELHGASLVLGSATPSVEDYYLATKRQRPIIPMQQLAIPADTPVTIEMADMRQHELFSRSPILSDNLLARIAAALKAGEQSLLYLNRRGTANAVLCSSCGWQSLCPNCDLALTYHGDAHELRCHVCGYAAGLPTSCPVCGNTEILFKSIGTKAVVDNLAKLFPAAKIQRFDTDAKKAERLERHVAALAEGSADIIVGTQMVGKGLDLPKLSVVGIINADSSLLIPDYTAAEQTYQLISQVVGRVGRGHRAGTVVVQTYDPENTTLQAAVRREWENYYLSELAERRQYRFPPFVYLLKLSVLRATSAAAQKTAQSLVDNLQKEYPGITVDGPAPSFHPRERGKYRWQLLVKAPHRKTLTDIIAGLPSGWNYDIDPVNLL